MKILLVDNYDSFTYNLYQQLARISGYEPLVYLNDEISLSEVKQLKPDLIVLSPGPGRPERTSDFGICGPILAQMNTPLLGICLGFQGLAHHFGASVIHAPEPRHGYIDSLHHSGRDLFSNIPQGFRVVRYHSLTLLEPLPQDLDILAHAEDGVIMALRHRTLPLWGLQFHPESICSQYGDQLIGNVLRLACLTPRPWKAHTPPSPALTSHDRPLNYQEFKGSPPAENVYLQLFAARSNHFWLDSSLVREGLSRYSMMGASDEPGAMLVRYNLTNQHLTIQRDGHTEHRNESIFTFLERVLTTNKQEASNLPFPFTGGFVGYLGYELKAECGGEQAFTSKSDDAVFIFASRFLVFDHQAHKLFMVALAESGTGAEQTRWFEHIRAQLAQTKRQVIPANGVSPRPIHCQHARHHEGYLQDIQSCLEQIYHGESYEICLTNCVHVTGKIDPLALYLRLRQLNPAPYASCLRFDDTWILSSSPEQFLRIKPDGQVSSKPIKGTHARDKDPQKDQAAALALARSEKDRSENLMIVDLLRNDLGKVCQIGTVHVPVLMEVESYATVHQLVSTVRGQLGDVSVIDCIRAAFPGGSMTGAPKRRTMTIIDQLETEARGIYSGAIGYLGLDGAADLAIVIRTIVADKQRTTIGCGGAIVADSQPDQEFEEIILKAAVLLEAIATSPEPAP